jgi:hypothetical protein
MLRQMPFSRLALGALALCALGLLPALAGVRAEPGVGAPARPVQDGLPQASASTVTAVHQVYLPLLAKAYGACGDGGPAGLQGFVAADPMSHPRAWHTATLLRDGQVLLAGGWQYNGPTSPPTYFDTAELWNPATGHNSATGSMAIGRNRHTASLLADGTVLIAGGWGGDWAGEMLASAEIYQPASGTFTSTGSLATARYDHTATVLPDGQVLIAGGIADGQPIAAAELYDPLRGVFTATASLIQPRWGHTATLLDNGTVLIVGGRQSADAHLASAEIYDPANGAFHLTGNMSEARFGHSATHLGGGRVLVAGGQTELALPLDSSEIYDRASGTFTMAARLRTARSGHSATLAACQVLIAGGWSDLGVLTSSELYDDQAGEFRYGGDLAAPRSQHSATVLFDGTVLVAGGFTTPAGRHPQTLRTLERAVP